MKYYKYFLLTLAVILVDQSIKMLVHFNMEQNETIPSYMENPEAVFKINYVTNPGMAFGIIIPGQYGKLILSVFRLLAMVVIVAYTYRLAKRNYHPGLMWCAAAILGGALGNVIDSTFYGVIFGPDLTSSIPDPTIPGAFMDPPTPWFHGKVIDMFHIDICDCRLPEWMPWKFSGMDMPLWPIFNFADASIFCGVAIILIYQRRFFKEKVKPFTISEISTRGSNMVMYLGEFTSHRLDYSLASLQSLDAWIEGEMKNGTLKSSSVLKREYSARLADLTCYLGETIIKNNPGVQWLGAKEKLASTENLTLSLTNGVEVCPAEYIKQRLEGKGPSLSESYKAILNQGVIYNQETQQA